jgi:integrase
VIYRRKGSRYLYIRFKWKGRKIDRSSRCLTRKDAKVVEARIRSELALGNFGILEPEDAPSLAEFLAKDFLPFAEAKHKEVPKTVAYYRYGCRTLSRSKLSHLKLDAITDQQAHQLAALKATLSPSTINCTLRTLRHVLKLAEQWGKIERAPKITLAKGEQRRERILSSEEVETYLGACEQPWRDIATILIGTGMRPGEFTPSSGSRFCLENRRA